MLNYDIFGLFYITQYLFIPMPTINELQKISSQVRRDIIRMVNGAASGHPGGALGTADLMVALYFQIMRPDPHNFQMDGKGEDVFLLSNGHLSTGWYSVLARYGFFDIRELATFRKIGSRLQGHPTTNDGLPGVRMSSGSLGQGLSVAIGVALSKRMNNDKSVVYCLMGDGELQEGQNWEAFLYASAKKIDNLIAIIDYNGKQIDGSVENIVSLGDLPSKFKAFGWHVFEMIGNDILEVVKTINIARESLHNRQPVVIVMSTHMGYGVDFMLDNHEWHGVPPNNEQAAKALAQIEETLGDY